MKHWLLSTVLATLVASSRFQVDPSVPAAESEPAEVTTGPKVWTFGPGELPDTRFARKVWRRGDKLVYTDEPPKDSDSSEDPIDDEEDGGLTEPTNWTFGPESRPSTKFLNRTFRKFDTIAYKDTTEPSISAGDHKPFHSLTEPCNWTFPHGQRPNAAFRRTHMLPGDTWSNTGDYDWAASTGPREPSYSGSSSYVDLE